MFRYYNNMEEGENYGYAEYSLNGVITELDKEESSSLRQFRR